MADKQQETHEPTIQHIRLDVDWDHRAALASVRIGAIVIHGIAVWKSPRSGRLQVFFPSYTYGPQLYADAIELPAELRSAVEAEVMAAYRAEKKREANKSKQKGLPTE